MDDTEFDKLMDQGKNLGFEGKELYDFVDRERNRRREERDAERAYFRQQAEFEMEQERERSRLRIQEERELLTVRQQPTPQSGQTTASETAGRMQHLSPHKLMPRFNEERDDLDAYLRRFEHVAQSQRWPREDWATALSLCLSGEALNVFSRMSASECTDYDKLKKALMTRFRLTEEGFRDKFRKATPNNNETCSQFLTRLRHFLERWVELSGAGNRYDALFELVLKEQFLSTCATALELFLRENTDASLTEMVRRAEQYTEAHGWRNFSRGAAAGERPKTPAIRTGQSGDYQPPAGAKRQPEKHCFLCARTGHNAESCRLSNGGKGDQRKPCQICGKLGHPAWKCWKKGTRNDSVPAKESAAACIDDGFLELRNGEKVPVVSAGITEKYTDVAERLPVLTGLVGGQEVRVLRDTGCNTVVVKTSLVNDDDFIGTSAPVYLLDRSVRMLREAWVDVDTPYYTGRLKAKCLDNPIYDLILGNVEGVRTADDPDVHWRLPKAQEAVSKTAGSQDTRVEVQEPLTSDTTEERQKGQEIHEANPAVTRSQSGRQATQKKLRVPQISLGISREALVEEQKSDPTLQTGFNRLNVEKRSKNGDRHVFFMQDGLLQRRFVSKSGEEFSQVVVPEKLRVSIMQLAHDGAMGGHQGAKKTLSKIHTEFFWPGMHADVKRFVASCDICQRTAPKGHTRKVPLVKVPIISTPFEKVAIDIVGPLFPRSTQGNKYILTMVDYATRYPDAVALPSVETERVAEALVEMFSRVGVPREVLSDRGTNFTSEVMKEVSRLLSLKQLHTTPYHPMANGLVERFNGTLKQMVKRMCQEKPKDWDRYLAPLLFAYREVPQESLGFSPFELLYGRSVRGPLAVLRELWTDTALSEELKTTYEYVISLREKLEHTCRLAHEELERAGERYGKYYNLKSRKRSLKPGEQILILLPTDNNKLLMQWKGPFNVVSRRGDVHYEVEIGGSSKIFHINMLKRYQTRSHDIAGAGAVVNCEDPESGDIELLPPHQAQSFHDVKISDDLSVQQRTEVIQLLQEHQQIFSDLPGKTELAECKLELTSERPVHVRQYPMPFALRGIIEEEVGDMLKLGIVERSESPFNSPVIAVRKPDGTHRLCIDFRRLNEVLVDDAEPIPRSDELLATVGTRRFFSKLDFAKGYWQVPLTPEARPKTAFATESGHYQFRYMPFGIKTAPAVFTKLMRRVLSSVPDVAYYYDDVLIASATWGEHCRTLREVFLRIGEAGLTVKPAKCEIGMHQISFLGHQIGAGELSPLSKTLDKIQKAPRPATKRQVRSFLGLAGYYREFISDYATLTSPLSDLTRKGLPNNVNWGADQENAFAQLKKRLTTAPILKLPDFERQFVLRTDASDRGIGAVLLQEHDHVLHPVAYASRKLLPREVAYSTVEKEALALVWGIEKFQVFLYGRRFLVQTDHEPLKFIQGAKSSNGRVLRWSLKLQQYSFRVQHIKGSENVGADYMSRIDDEEA
ncbi:uncharacterized protein LOC119397715 [Rhipicephalus sanguineus]|uniref:uncharacterized protein LOC119397715 n=1 Tax=Rhipicephalus sanguineus TaxID=34632 RepID=UPI0018933604|nr:uncharacterized protein LOC119397715 [Rhipicephalus sanguineus]